MKSEISVAASIEAVEFPITFIRRAVKFKSLLVIFASDSVSIG